MNSQLNELLKKLWGWLTLLFSGFKSLVSRVFGQESQADRDARISKDADNGGWIPKD